MARLSWLPGVLRSAGLRVEELAGWDTRGRADITVQGVVCHHTATGTNWSDAKVAALLRDGRPDLAGPLSQLGLSRNGTFVVVASGRCSHNGFGEWGNNSVGIEAYNSGTGEPWPAAQLDAYQRGAAAILRHVGLPASRCKGHKETDPSRKIDPAGIDMAGFRSTVAAHLAGTQSTEESLDMTPEQASTLDKIAWMLGQVKPCTDLLPAMQAAADRTAWGVLDPAAGLRVMVAELAGRPVATIDAATIAAAIPADLAQQVADELAGRLRD